MTALVGNVTNIRVGHDNIFRDGTITSSSEAADYPKENIADYKQYDWWRPTGGGVSWIRSTTAYSRHADYFAVWGHNLHEVNGWCKPQYSTDGGSTWTDAATFIKPVTSKTLVFEFDIQPAADWRLYVSADSAPSIAGIHCGVMTQFDSGLKSGFASPTISPMVEYKTAMSELGVNLGVSVLRSGLEGRIDLNNLDPDWVLSDLKPLIAHLTNGYPAIMAWDRQDYTAENFLFWLDRAIDPPTYQSPLYMQCSISFQGIE